MPSDRPNKPRAKKSQVINDSMVRNFKEYLGGLFQGNEQRFMNILADFNEPPQDASEAAHLNHLNAVRDRMYQVDPSMWAILEMAVPAQGLGADQSEKYLEQMEESGDKRLQDIAAAVKRYRGRSKAYGKLPARPSESEALSFLENNFSPAFGLRGPLNEQGQPSEDWARALDVVKQSPAHTYHFFFNVLNKDRDPLVRWPEAEPILKKEPMLWPYYVWLVPGMKQIYPDVPMPKTSREISDEREQRGFSDKYLADSVAEGEEVLRRHQETSSSIEDAYIKAAESKTQRTDLEPTIAQDPDSAMGYFQRVLMPNGWRSKVVEDTISRNRNHYHERDIEMFDARESQAPEGMSPSQALDEAIKYMESKGKTFPELEAAIAPDLKAISEYVEKVLKPKNLGSQIISDAIRKFMDSDTDRSIGILLHWNKEMALTIFTEYIERLANSDPEKMVSEYDRWKGELDSDILRKIVERYHPRPKKASVDSILALLIKARSKK